MLPAMSGMSCGMSCLQISVFICFYFHIQKLEISPLKRTSNIVLTLGMLKSEGTLLQSLPYEHASFSGGNLLKFGGSGALIRKCKFTHRFLTTGPNWGCAIWQNELKSKRLQYFTETDVTGSVSRGFENISQILPVVMLFIVN